jgi:putative transposase
MTDFIEEHRGTYGVEPMCKILQIAPSTYYGRRAIARDPAITGRRCPPIFPGA